VMGLLEEQEMSLILLDLTMPHISGEALLRDIKSQYPHLPVIIITGINDLTSAVDCMKWGAHDYLVKAIENSKLLASVNNALHLNELHVENKLLIKSLLKVNPPRDPAFNNIITEDSGMFSIFQYLSVISPSSHSILIRGETGTGKELIADAIHKISNCSGDFISLNVAGLDDVMFSDTLFGHKKGAFSGADSNRTGLVQEATGGTLFLDEIGDLSMASQIKLLRLLEKGDFYSLGSDSLKRSSCRILAATNIDLEEAIEGGRFRKDLYYRLASHEIHVPPLRERRGDIPLLVNHFVLKAAKELRREPPAIGANFLHELVNRTLSGNVRELISLINRAVGTCSGSVLGESDEFEPVIEDGRINDSHVQFPETLPDLKTWSDLLVDEAVRRSRGNITSAAGLIGISQPAMSKRLIKKKLHVSELLL